MAGEYSLGELISALEGIGRKVLSLRTGAGNGSDKKTSSKNLVPERGLLTLSRGVRGVRRPGLEQSKDYFSVEKLVHVLVHA